jgi:3-deoxy-alpha-D-manno-octulosonate 8-oxidase
MVASYMGGLSLTYSEVGVCHALSYGLGKVLEIHHCIANCIAFDKLEDVYGDYVQEFKGMVKHNKVHIPQGLAKDWSEETISAMAEGGLQPAAHVGPRLRPGLAAGAGPRADQGVVSRM